MNELKRQFKRRKRELKKEYLCDLNDIKSDYKQALELEKIRKAKTRDLAAEKAVNGEITSENGGANGASDINSKAYRAECKKKGLAPRRSLLEEIGNAVSHGIGSVFAVCAFVLMMISADNTRQIIAACVYGAGMFIMFTMSCLYHSFKFGSKAKRVFRRFDYLSIYLLIGASFAPLLLCYTDNDFGLVFFIVQWAIIAAGITLVAVFGPARLRFIHIPLYFILGWSALVLIPNMIIAKDFDLLFWILGGGILYTVGIIPFAVDRKVAHFIWHIFVLLGAVVQWLGIYLCIYLA